MEFRINVAIARSGVSDRCYGSYSSQAEAEKDLFKHGWKKENLPRGVVRYRASAHAWHGSDWVAKIECFDYLPKDMLPTAV